MKPPLNKSMQVVARCGYMPPPTLQVVARYGYMDVVDHGQGFIDNLMEHVAAQIEKAATEVGGVLYDSRCAYSLLCQRTRMIVCPLMQGVPGSDMTLCAMHPRRASMHAYPCRAYLAVTWHWTHCAMHPRRAWCTISAGRSSA